MSVVQVNVLMVFVHAVQKMVVPVQAIVNVQVELVMLDFVVYAFPMKVLM